jgi:tetratricopeptide (TPR) repeat protein
MTRTLLTLAFCISISTLATQQAAAQGRGGGYSRGGSQRGGYGGGGRGYEGGGGGMSHSPSFSQPPSGSMNANRNPNAAGAAAGAGYANKNQPQHSTAAGAAAGAGYENRNQPQHPNAAPAAAGAGYANRNNQSQYSNAGAAAAGAGYANRNQNQNQYSNAAAAGAGAAYANNNNGYNSGAGYWNGNYGNGSAGNYGGTGMASPAYGYGSTPYVNPYASVLGTGTGAGQPVNQGQPGNAPAGNSSGYDYTQPVNLAAPANTPTPADPTTDPVAQASQAFQVGDYAGAVQFTQQALRQSPNDVNLHQLLALGQFAQGQYEQAAAPLYAVLAVGPGWDWTTLIGHYPDASVYTGQLRGLEAFVKANPQSARSRFVQAYQYICQGQGQAAIKPLKAVLAIQPNDSVSAQLLDSLQPQAAAAQAQLLNPSKLPGVWVAQAAQNAKVTLTISDDANFTWAFAAPGQPPVTITGTYALANGVLTLNGKDAPGGPLAGKVASPDDAHMSFKAIGAPSNDPGLQFVR